MLLFLTAKFDHQLVWSAPLVLSCPLQFQPLLGVALKLQPIPGVPSTSSSASSANDGIRRHGVGWEAVRLWPVQLRLQARQLPAKPQAHPQDWGLQVETALFIFRSSQFSCISSPLYFQLCFAFKVSIMLPKCCSVIHKAHSVTYPCSLFLSCLFTQLRCDFCSKPYTNYMSLRNHMRIHGQKRYMCDLCGKAFRLARYLRNHQRIHDDGPNRFDCPSCCKSYRTMLELAQHRCTAAASNQVGLRRHDACPILYWACFTC